MKKELIVRDKTVDSIISGIVGLEGEALLLGSDLIKLRFRQGALLQPVMDAKKYGDAIVKQIAKETKISDVYLYQCHSFARHFDFKIEMLEKDINDKLNEGKKINITRYLKEIAPSDKPENVGGEKNHKELVNRRIEDGAKAVEEGMQSYPQDDEVKGASMAYVEAFDAGEFLVGNPERMPLSFTDAWRNKEYCDWLRAEPCAITEARPVDVAHMQGKGRAGNQSHDSLALPLVRDVHRDYDKMNDIKAFEEKYSKLTGKKINVRAMVLDHLHRYIEHLQKLAKF